MCVIAVAWQLHPEWPLVVIANRDELHERPTQPLARWSDPEGVIAGRDLQKGGTWLGISEAGRFAALVNVPGDAGVARLSRGLLVLDVLSGRGPNLDRAGIFGPFNLLALDLRSFTVTTNCPGSAQRSLSPGVHSLSSAVLDAKADRATIAKHSLVLCLARPNLSSEPLIDVLGPAHSTGSTGDMKADEPPLFIKDPVYGTRCSTAVLVDRSGAGIIHERRYGANGVLEGDTLVEFRWP